MYKQSATIFISIFFFATFCFAQPNTIPQKLQLSFAGTWQNTLKFKGGYSTSTIIIQFEDGKDYATFTDIATAEAPTITLWARPINDSVLAIQAAQERNDYVELEIIKGKLEIRTRPTLWDADGKPLNPDGAFLRMKKFRRITK